MDSEQAVRAERFEVVDGDGRVRGAFGALHTGPDGEAVFGFELLDDQGQPRVCIAMSETGPVIQIEQGGNAVVCLGAHDSAGDVLDAGAYLVLCDGAGTPVAGWAADPDGRLTDLPVRREGR